MKIIAKSKNIPTTLLLQRTQQRNSQEVIYAVWLNMGGNTTRYKQKKKKK